MPTNMAGPERQDDAGEAKERANCVMVAVRPE